MTARKFQQRDLTEVAREVLIELKERRAESQIDIGTRAGVPQSTVSAFLRGDRGARLDTLNRMCAADPEYFELLLGRLAGSEQDTERPWIRVAQRLGRVLTAEQAHDLVYVLEDLSETNSTAGALAILRSVADLNLRVHEETKAEPVRAGKPPATQTDSPSP